MRLILHNYADGQHHFYETSDDGKVLKQNIEGKRRIGERISSYVEIGCIDGPLDYEQTIRALRRLIQEVESRIPQDAAT